MSLPNNNLKKHPILQLHKDIAEICKPFFQRSVFCFLNIIRLFENGRVLYLCDNPDWLQYYLCNGFPKIGAFEQNPIFQQEEYVLWSALGKQDPILIYTREMFNLHHGITLISPFAGGYDYFNFGTYQKEQTCLSELETQVAELRSFSKVLLDKIKIILTKYQSYALDLSGFNQTPNLVLENKPLYLGANYDYAHLTPAELKCLKKLISGQNVPEIAHNLKTSIRTVEKHIEHIKQKLDCRTQCELGYLAAKLNIGF